MAEDHKILSRTPFLITTVVFGVASCALIVFSIYTVVVTPGIDQVPIYVDQHLQRMENKAVYLSIAPLFATFFFFAVGYCTLTWNSYVRRIEERRALYIS